jgi:16S rRNA G966 N2-methylase RsmD
MQTHCKFDELIDPKKLKNHPKNRNKHGNDQIERLAKMYEYHGIRHPIIVSKLSGCIVAGHGRKLAAIRAGIKEFPVVYQDFESADHEYTFIQADNAIALWAELDLSGINTDLPDLGPDFDINMLGIKDFVLEPSEKYDETKEDDVPDKAEAICKLGQIWKLGDHRLMCGDSTNIEDVKKLMDGQKADMVYTDPPYGISVVGGKPFGSIGGGKICKPGVYKKILNDETPETAIRSFNTVQEFCEGPQLWWGGNYYSHKLPASKKWIVWDKQTTGNFADCELAWTNQDGAVIKFQHQWNGLIKESERGTKRVHPTQKPIALCEWSFKELNPDGKSVMDIFGGSGSTLIACEKTNRKCFMMELDEHYCDVIITRWEQYTGKKAELLNG